MAGRLNTFLPRVALLVLAALGATAGLTFAAGQQIATTSPGTTTGATTAGPLTVTVPDLRNQAFVFAKGQLEDGGFAWKVRGGVQAFPANTVVSQSPAPGTKLIDTGAPLVTVTLARNSSYAETGTPENTSPYTATPLKLASVTAKRQPAPAQTTTAATTPAVTTPTAAAKKPATTPTARPPAFVVPGARKEPLDEIPLPARASALGRWLAAHPTPSNANEKYWLYQNAWVVTGARMGWWHGAQALRTLIAVDQRTETLWGVGAKSESLARRALADVEARAK